MSLVARGLRRRFGAEVAVDDLSLAVPGGELYGLVGPDGAGKTTTLRMLAGLLVPEAGTVEVDGQRLGPDAGPARAALGYMPQQYSLYGDLSVDENLTFFGRLFGLPKAERAARMERLLHITRLTRFRDRRAEALSGGMYKKLALACALLHQPRVLLLDEPSNGVDPVSRRELWDLLHDFVEGGMAVLLCTPYMDEAARCHRVGLLHHGRLLAEGAPADLVARFRHPTTRLFVDDRDRVEAALAADDAILAVSPEGAALRVVARAEAGDVLARYGGRVEPVAADFEDVFLGLLRDPTAIARAA
ncbi:MAG: ABC transporter ATP-binding protein [Myxococcales bacterium]|nr:ABC transporter ATP-binding protein [Myxococcales bacterium]